MASTASRLGALGLALLLTACGGGSDGGGGFLPTGPDTGPDLLDYTIFLRVVDEQGNDITQVSESRPARLLITVTEDTADRAPVPGLVVSATSDFAVIAPENGQALTNSGGSTEMQIISGTLLGADTITVTAESPAGTVTETIGVEIVGAAGDTLGFFDGTAFVPGRIGLSTDIVPFRGSAVLRLAIVDPSGSPITAPQSILLRSACSASGLASLRVVGDPGAGSATLTVETVDGLATAEYLSGSCEGTDQISASIVDGDSEASASIGIAPSDADFIGYVTSDPLETEEGSGRTIIALPGTGGAARPETATIVFEVLEEAVELAAGDPLPGQAGYFDLPTRFPLAGVRVNFALTDMRSGIELINTSDVTDANGIVEAEVISGNVAASTRVTAQIDESSVTDGAAPSATSNEIVVSTGFPDQNSISLSSSVFNVPRARSVDGVSATITVRMADKFNNPVANGTAAIFTTEYGTIDGSCLTGQSNGALFQAANGDTAPQRGTCSVIWQSQAPRFPVFNQDLIQTIADDGSYSCRSHTSSRGGPCPDDLGAIRGLRSTILVTAVGDESFIDSNGNGVYDEGETFENLPEAFLDMNEDGVYTPFYGPQCPPPSTDENCAAAGAEETFVDRNQDGEYSENLDPAIGAPVYNGSLCPADGDGVYCSREQVNVRRQFVLTLSAPANNLFALVGRATGNPRPASDSVREGEVSEIYVSDIFNNPPGAGTTLTLNATGDCKIVQPEDTETLEVVVPNISGGPGAFTTRIVVNGTGAVGGGAVSLSATDPDSGSTSFVDSFACITTCSEREDPTDPTSECAEEL
ncbi:MAG: hypothetical protein V2I82_13985 [Halieaceae bacterium]|nr:hypothetical protein [Halieaceae bacterium]